MSLSMPWTFRRNNLHIIIYKLKDDDPQQFWLWVVFILGKMSVFLDLVNRKRVINDDAFISAQWQKAIFFDFLKIIVIRLKSEQNNVIYNLFEGLLIIFFKKMTKKFGGYQNWLYLCTAFRPKTGLRKQLKRVLWHVCNNWRSTREQGQKLFPLILKHSTTQ